jgi:hypothetical protein
MNQFFDSTPDEEIDRISSDDVLRESKRLKYEPSPNNKIQFHSKIKPNKHIELINVNEEEKDTNEQMMDIGVSEIVAEKENINNIKNSEIVQLDIPSGSPIEDENEKLTRRSQRIKTKLSNQENVDDLIQIDDQSVTVSGTQKLSIEANVFN